MKSLACPRHRKKIYVAQVEFTKVGIVWDAVREEGRSQILQDVVSYDENFEFYSKRIGMPSDELQAEERNNCNV